MAKHIKVTLINGDVRESIIDNVIDYKEMIDANALITKYNTTETFIPLSAIISIEVKEKE